MKSLSLPSDIRGDSTWYVLPLLLLSILSPVLAIPLIFINYTGHPTKSGAVASSFLVGFAMAVISYGIIYKDTTVDAIRLMNECIALTGQPLHYALIHPASGFQGLVVLNVWEWLVGLTGDPRLFQASAAFFGYSLISWTMFDGYLKWGISVSKYISLWLFIAAAIPMQPVVGNVRSALVCIMSATAFYLQSNQSSWSTKAIVLLLLACGIHYLAVLPAAIFLAHRQVCRAPWKTGLIFGGIIMLVSAFSLLLSSYFSSGGFFAELMQKVLLYKEGTHFDQVYASSAGVQFRHILDIILLLLLIVRSKKAKSTNNYIRFAIVATICVVAMEFNLTNVGMRLMYLPLLLSAYSMLEETALIEDEKNTFIALDFSLFLIAAFLSAYSWVEFLATINVPMFAASVLFPLSSIWMGPCIN